MSLPITGEAEIDGQHSVCSEMIEHLQENHNQFSTRPRFHSCNPSRYEETCRNHTARLKAFVVRIADFLTVHKAYKPLVSIFSLPATAEQRRLLIYCGITMARPVTELVRAYEAREKVATGLRILNRLLTTRFRDGPVVIIALAA